MARQILATFGVDVDAVSGWLGSYGGADSPSDIQRSIWEVGTPRLVRLFDRYGLRTSWSSRGRPSGCTRSSTVARSTSSTSARSGTPTICRP